MAGSFPGGGADRFRDGIRFAMEMAAAPEVDRQVLFFFPSQLVFVDPGDEGTAVDAEGVPFDPNVPVQRQTPPPVQVPCAVEYFDVTGQQVSGFGPISASRIKVLLLDDEHAQVEGCERVEIDGDVYWYRRTQPPSGLFDVGIFEMWFHAEQET
jgi:hypothetical protein